MLPLLPILGLAMPVISGLVSDISKSLFGGKGEPRTVEERVQLMDAETKQMKAQAEIAQADKTEWSFMQPLMADLHPIIKNILALILGFVMALKEGTRPLLCWGSVTAAYLGVAFQFPETQVEMFMELAFTAFNYYMGDRGMRYLRGQLTAAAAKK